jgi:hypothetical protein
MKGSPKRKDQVIAQKAASDFLLFNMDDGNYFSLNEVGSRVWELCDGSRTVAQLLATLADEYDAPRDVLENDILKLLEELQAKDLILEGSGPASPAS